MYLVAYMQPSFFASIFVWLQKINNKHHMPMVDVQCMTEIKNFSGDNSLCSHKGMTGLYYQQSSYSLGLSVYNSFALLLLVTQCYVIVAARQMSIAIYLQLYIALHCTVLQLHCTVAVLVLYYSKTSFLPAPLHSSCSSRASNHRTKDPPSA